MSQPSAATTILAGGIAGVSETLVTYPAEFIKTRRQLPQNLLQPPTSTSIIASTYRSFGLVGFYSGCQALATSNAFKAGIRFMTFEHSRAYLAEHLPSSTPGSRNNPAVTVLAGISAGVSESILVVTPGETLKTRLVHDATLGPGARRFANGGLMAVAKTIVREEGPLALWRGLGPVLCKQGTNSAVRFTTFGMLQEQVAARWPKLDGNVGTTLALGAVSGVLTVYASMPFDNVKTRMQSSGHDYRSMLDCAGRTLRNEGVGAFWRGTSPRLVRLTLSSGITFTVYDQMVRAINSFQDLPQTDLLR